MKTQKPIVDTLFYTGGTITENDIKPISKSPFYNGKAFAINDNYLFLFQGKKLIKAVKWGENSIYTYKVLKTKVKIIRASLEEMLDDKECFWECTLNNLFDRILENTKGA